ncbi:hypothetical protein ACIHCQ_21535 [Streptomyces sp. NPDC052236]|uniref:hypothetical protein n=1 Tax=Streptomyces sp. NPDC052236 TaxID=3365686 RepID=UPI0037D94325
MRTRTALLTIGAAILAVGGTAATAQAATAQATTTIQATTVQGPTAEAAWVYIGQYTSKSRCKDVGAQYVREGFNEYKCQLVPIYGWYDLYVR